ncbi:arsenic resistance N-acetyltransferase ArsN2 [Brevundimonas mediterranea]|uniref:N-acetylglutamate synthase-like GNAT family acetyltransferase n=1 Tax=Brevundimonas mediterranea TaxID=74329 RepID=A0A7W6A5M6_9CAUL|nr:arsenic resistance N-acetyltransferase ArsN2 [Brevundimonas mediterranea]MBB3873781.1 N-acetylglutamate synthase-like GNAT family acetyltransferase [Brevundimonas mediterranea]
MVALRVVDASDRGLIAALAEAGLPEPGAGRYFGATQYGDLVAYVGLEGEGRHLLLRSLVVLPDHRARGAGARLLTAAEDVARDLGAETLHLLTTTAEAFFARRGFVRGARETAPEAILRAREFAALCPASAAYMTKAIS